MGFREQLKQRLQNEQKAFRWTQDTLRYEVQRDGKTGLNALWSAKSNKDAIQSVLRLYDVTLEKLQSESAADAPFLEASLKDDWYLHAVEPMIAFDGEGNYTALIPGKLQGYYYIDPEGRKLQAGSRRAKSFTKAYTFYRLLPAEQISYVGILRYLISFWSKYDLLVYGIILLLSMAAAMMISGSITSLLEVNDITRTSTAATYAVPSLILLFSLTASGLLNIAYEMIYCRLQNKSVYNYLYSVASLFSLMTTDRRRDISNAKLWALVSDQNNFADAQIRILTGLPLTVLYLLVYLMRLRQVSGGTLWIILGMFLIQILVSTSLSVAYSKIFYSGNVLKLELSAEDQNIFSSILKIRESRAEFLVLKHRMYLRQRTIGKEKRLNLTEKLIALTGVISPCLYTLILIFFAYSSGMSASSLVLSNVLGVLILNQGRAVSDHIAGSAKCFGAWKTLRDFVSLFQEEKGGFDLSSMPASISFQNVSFTYEGNHKKTIDDLNLTIRRGEYVAVVGRSGCGKTTLLKLLIRLLEPESGVILFGSRDLSSISRKSLTALTGIVMQNDSAFCGTILENMRLKKNISESEVWEILDEVGISDVIRDLPYGLNTVLSNEHPELSGGQMQRLLIARALVNDPPLLLMDEATSALDNISQNRIREVLDGRSATKFIIAHRLSTVQNCDRILVMEDGRICEEGRFEELIAKKGKFYQLMLRQT